MKNNTGKKRTTKQTVISLVISAVIGLGIFFGVQYGLKKDPYWHDLQSFRNNTLFTGVELSSWQGKSSSSRQDFFLVHQYDFTTAAFGKDIKVMISSNDVANSGYLGFNDQYLWFKTPGITAVDILNPAHPIISEAMLCKRICAANPELFREVTDLDVVEHYLQATNQDGDAFYLHLRTLKASREGPVPFYAYHADYTITPALPETLQEMLYTGNQGDYTFPEDEISAISLKPVNSSNLFQSSFYRIPLPENTISFTATDTTQVLVTSDEAVSVTPGASLTQTPEVPEKRLTGKVFINAKGLGMHNKRYVFICQKANRKDAPWFLSRFDPETGAVTETDLSSKGVKLEKPADVLFCKVSLDGVYVFFHVQNRVPVRVKL